MKDCYQYNRLKHARKAFRYTESQIATQLGLSLQSYKLLEEGKAFVDYESLIQLSKLYKNLSIDFLIGRPFRITVEFKDWHPEDREEYSREDQDVQLYLEYRFGKGKFCDNDGFVYIPEYVKLTSAEQTLIREFRECNQEGQNKIRIAVAQIHCTHAQDR